MANLSHKICNLMALASFAISPAKAEPESFDSVSLPSKPELTLPTENNSFTKLINQYPENLRELIGFAASPDFDPDTRSGMIDLLTSKKLEIQLTLTPAYLEILKQDGAEPRVGDIYACLALSEEGRQALREKLITPFLKGEVDLSKQKDHSILATRILASKQDPASRDFFKEIIKSDCNKANKIEAAIGLVLLNDFAGYPLVKEALEDRKVDWTIIGKITRGRSPVLTALTVTNLEGIRSKLKYNDGIVLPDLKSDLIEALKSPELPKADKAALINFSTLIEKAEKAGIYSPFRFSEPILKRLLEDRTKIPEKGQKVAIIAAAREDWNGAFQCLNNDARVLIAAGYLVKYYEAADEEGLAVAIHKGSHFDTKSGKTKVPSNLIILAGHGSPKELLLSGYLEIGKIDYQDDDLFSKKGITQALKMGGQIVLISCSTGHGKNEATNLANFIRKKFPQAAPESIFSPTEDYCHGGVILDSNGKVIDISSDVPIYKN